MDSFGYLCRQNQARITTKEGQKDGSIIEELVPENSHKLVQLVKLSGGRIDCSPRALLSVLKTRTEEVCKPRDNFGTKTNERRKRKGGGEEKGEREREEKRRQFHNQEFEAALQRSSEQGKTPMKF